MSILAQGGGGGEAGTVTSVSVSMPPQFNVTGVPFTIAGEAVVTWAQQLANTVLAAPDGSNGAPVFRALVAADIPALAYAATSHTHAAADTTTGVFDNARVNWAAPDAIGSTTPPTSATLRNLYVYHASSTAQSLPVSGHFARILDASSLALDFQLVGSTRWGVVSRFRAIRIGRVQSFTNEPTSYVEIGDGDTAQVFLTTTGGTNAVANVLALRHNNTGTPTTGFGTGFVWQMKSSTTNDVQAGRLATLWHVATHASREADGVFELTDYAGTRTIWHGRADGTAPRIAFLGAAPVARQAAIADAAGGATVDTEARTAINTLLAAVRLFGLIAT